MAKVLNPLNSSEARGRVGGLVYNTWRGIRTVKTHTDPAHQSDPLRQAHKLVVQEQAQRWKTLSDVERADWNAYADAHPDIDWTGRPVRLAGFHMFVRLQTHVVDMLGYFTSEIPDAPCDLMLEDFANSLVGSDVELTWDTSHPDPGWEHYLQIMRTHPLSAGRQPTLHDAYLLAWRAYNFGGYSDEGLPAGTYTYFARPFWTNGTHGAWLSTRATVPP
jgi:hypothetical protein